MKHATITDIAHQLGISVSTVSRALNDHPDIKNETKEQVQKLAAKLKYKPNPIAQSLKNNRTTTIGVIVPEIKHDFFASAISGIEEIAYKSGYTIILCQSNESYQREVINTDVLIQQRVAGLIVSISQETNNSDHFKVLLDRKIPLVFFDRVCEDINANKVVIDDSKSAFIAVNHLVERGYKKIAHFTGPDNLGICKRRLIGYLDALKQANILVRNEFIRTGGLHEIDGYNSMDDMIKANVIPDAIFAVNDPVAIGAFQRIKEEGLKIPQNIGIIGFSNNKVTSLVDPPLTTVNQPSFEMGKKSAEILIKMIEKDEQYFTPHTYILDAELIVRGSS